MYVATSHVGSNDFRPQLAQVTGAAADLDNWTPAKFRRRAVGVLEQLAIPEVIAALHRGLCLDHGALGAEPLGRSHLEAAQPGVFQMSGERASRHCGSSDSI